MIDIKKKYRTKSGLPVELISDKGRGNNPIIGYIGDFPILGDWTIDGKYEGNKDSDCDLIEVKEPKMLKCWVNFYHSLNNRYVCNVFYCKEQADEFAKGRIGEAVEVTLEVEE